MRTGWSEQNWLQSAHHAKCHETSGEQSWLQCFTQKDRNDKVNENSIGNEDPKVLNCRKEIKNKGVVKKARTTATQSLSTIL